MPYVSTPFKLDEHRTALVKLWKDNMSDGGIADVAEQRIAWLYEQNPLGPTLTWLVKDDASDAVVGCASLYPRSVSVRGQLMRAGIGIDLAVDKAHRVGGPAVILQRAVVKGSKSSGFAFTYTYPNKGSLPVLKRVGWQEVVEATHWVKPVRTGYKLASYLPNKTIAGTVSWVLDRALGLADWRHVVINAGRYRSAVIDRADARFDELWERARQKYVIVGDKSSAYLNWRYTNAKSGPFSFYCLTDRGGGTLAGFIVFTVRENKAFVADVFCQDLENTLSHLLIGFASKARRMRLDSVFIAYAGGSAFLRRLEGLDFIRREFARALVVTLPADMPEATKKTLLDPESWFIFDGELDL